MFLQQARDVVLEFQKKTMITVYIGYIALIVFAAAVSLFNKAVIKNKRIKLYNYQEDKLLGELMAEIEKM